MTSDGIDAYGMPWRANLTGLVTPGVVKSLIRNSE